MEAESPHKSLEYAFSQHLKAIELCAGNRLRGPALILLYSGIDIASSLDSDQLSVQARFTQWVDKYLLPGSSLNCTALDVYGARCGLVHSYSPISALSTAGRAIQIFYAWKPTSVADLKKLIEVGAELSRHVGTQPEYVVGLQGDDLIDSFQTGVTRFLNELERDPDRATAAYARAGHFIGDLPHDTAADMLKRAEAILRRKER